MHLRIHRPSFIPVEPRSYPRIHSPLSTYPPMSPYFSLDTHDHWSGKSIFPNLNIFSSGAELSSKPQKEVQTPPRRHVFHQFPPNIGRAYFDETTHQSKFSSDKIENYFTQMRITPRTRDIMSKDLNSRTKDVYRGYERESPTTTSPIETDESISVESLGTSSSNTPNSVNGGVGNNVPERNRVVLENIKVGLDTRTTIMIKNVPNKYTQVPLLNLCKIDCSKCLWNTSILRIQELMISCTCALISRIDASLSPNSQKKS